MHVLELISEVGLTGSKVVVTPLEMNKKLTTLAYNIADDPEIEDVLSFQNLIEK